MYAFSASVYPRVCGGTAVWDEACDYKTGLSPRVRGNHGYPQAHIDGGRSIPACAGEPPRRGSHHRTAPVYPRVCGGTTGPPNIGPPQPGLSPRVRGNPAPIDCEEEWVGSIPACAGEPARSSEMGRFPKVYPRVCGGTEWDCLDWQRYEGLSPRVRGNLLGR